MSRQTKSASCNAAIILLTVIILVTIIISSLPSSQLPVSFLSSGPESVGSSNMRKADEAKGPHRQRQVVAAEPRRHSGEFRYLKYTAVAAVKLMHFKI